MRQDSPTIRELYAKYQKKNMTRAERQELMEKIYRERYKTDPRKPVSQKGQAAVNAVYGIIIILISAFAVYAKECLTKSTTNKVYAMLLAVLVGFAIMTARFKKEPADELSKELMQKATAYSAWAEAFFVLAVGVAMSLTGKETFEITSTHVMTLAYALCGVYHLSRNAIYLWLDRTPGGEEE